MEIEINYNRESERRLVKAVSFIIEEEGFAKLGINHIARTAGCDKVLIYRYFGGLEGLLSAWAKENDFYTAAYDHFYEEVKSADEEQIPELTKKVLLSQLHYLRQNRVMQELLLWELSGRFKFKTLQDIRERNGHKLQQVLTNMVKTENNDLSIYITILITSIEFIILYTRQYSMFNGVDFSKPEAWKRYETVISHYIDMLFNTLIT